MRTFPRPRLVLVVAAFLAQGAWLGCSSSEAPSRPPSSAEVAPSSAGAAALVPGSAQIGKPAPDFELVDLDGKTTKLSDHAGKIVVLEWFNPDCPFVKRNHESGVLKELGKQLRAKGVVLLAINSGAPGKQGHGKEANVAGRDRYGIDYPILLDESGAVGRAYGAKATPHMFVVDAKGVLAYAGAIDNAPDGDPDDGKLVDYVSQAVEELSAGKPVSVPETKAYGCSVKYGG
jgi:peroxiredoxin